MSKRAKKVTAGILVLVMAVAAYFAIARISRLKEEAPEEKNVIRIFEIDSADGSGNASDNI